MVTRRVIFFSKVITCAVLAQFGRSVRLLIDWSRVRSPRMVKFFEIVVVRFGSSNGRASALHAEGTEIDTLLLQDFLAEWLRRMLKAHVRKSVGSIPTDCSLFLSQLH